MFETHFGKVSCRSEPCSRISRTPVSETPVPYPTDWRIVFRRRDYFFDDTKNYGQHENLSENHRVGFRPKLREMGAILGIVWNFEVFALDLTLDSILDAALDSTLNSTLDSILDMTLDSILDLTLDSTLDSTLESILDLSLNSDVESIYRQDVL